MLKYKGYRMGKSRKFLLKCPFFKSLDFLFKESEEISFFREWGIIFSISILYPCTCLYIFSFKNYNNLPDFEY